MNKSKLLTEIIKAIEHKNDSVICEGVFCEALDIEDGVLLWQKQSKWLGLSKDIKHYIELRAETKITQEIVSIWKDGEILFSTIKLQGILNDLKSNL